MDLTYCHTDSHSQAVILGEFPEHGKSSTTRVLDCVTEWTMRDITDTGLACIGTALTTNSTLKVLTLGDKVFPKATDEGLVPFLEALQRNKSLASLSIFFHSSRTVIEEDGRKCSKEFTETTEHENNIAMVTDRKRDLLRLGHSVCRLEQQISYSLWGVISFNISV